MTVVTASLSLLADKGPAEGPGTGRSPSAHRSTALGRALPAPRARVFRYSSPRSPEVTYKRAQVAGGRVEEKAEQLAPN